MEAAGGAARAERTRGRESSARSTAHELTLTKLGDRARILPNAPTDCRST